MNRIRLDTVRSAAGLPRTSFLALGALLAAACGSATTQGSVAPEGAPGAAPADSAAQAGLDPSGHEPGARTEPGAWTQRFLEPAGLVAEEIFISGPKGLLDHVVTADSEDTSYFVRTTVEGLLQERSAREGVEFVKIVTQVDQWRIVGTRKVEILERPGRVPVVIEARGDAYFNAGHDSPPEQAAVLRFVGEIES